MALKYYPPAHTDSDISVDFTDADIIHVADTFWNGHFPFIDYSTGGSIDGMIRAAEANVARATDKTIVIPGHGPIGNKSHLIEFRDMLVAIREKIAVKEGEIPMKSSLLNRPRLRREMGRLRDQRQKLHRSRLPGRLNHERSIIYNKEFGVDATRVAVAAESVCGQFPNILMRQ